MKFLIVGDVVGRTGVNMIKRHIPQIISKEKIDFCIINGENATGRAWP